MGGPIDPKLREAARDMLARMGGGAASDRAADAARVERAVLDVTIDGRTELVSVSVRDGKLVCTSSDGKSDGPYVRAALRMLAGEASAMIATTTAAGMAATILIDAAADGGEVGSLATESGRGSLLPGTVRTAPGSEPAPPPLTDRAALGRALDDLVTAVVRVGVREAHGSPSTEEAVQRLVEAAPSPLPLGVARFVGRLRAALASHDVQTTAVLLEGAARLASDVTVAKPTGLARRRIVSWLGASGDGEDEVERLFDRVLVEVGREWLAGIERSSIERRYLVDVQTGEVFREERARGGAGASVGPCPRLVTVGLAEAEEGAQPRRIRLLQYAVSWVVGSDEWARVAASAVRRFDALASTYRSSLTEFPGLVEPVALIAPAGWSKEEGAAPHDAEGLHLPIARADDPAGALALEQLLASQGDPSWIAGRLVDAGGTLMVVPCSAAFAHHDATAVRRLR